MSKIEVDQVDPQSGTNLTLGTSGDSILIPSGVTLANSGTMTGVPVPTTGIAASAISSGTIATARLGSGTASSSTFLRGDQTYAEAGGAITVGDQWRLTASKSTSSTQSIISANLEQIDTAGQGTLGSAMTESSGVFTFPSTGVYLVMSNVTYKNVSNNNSHYCEIVHKVTINNSSYLSTAYGYVYFNSISSTIYSTATAIDMIDVTDTSNVKIKFNVQSQQNAAIDASTNENYTCFTFIRLGDT